ncbi:gamma-glutamylcyclotransferase [Cyanobacterium stanieri LEGE 03274]|uniref:Gamma-glutamylcyclotransferase n=1 Tax=Cyanobacterium stanieri LEGE 03274 TaxID=1828756 RepID=A0ABR9V582_9CHRO|nr:gamma-glutamylcyclotransferase [Cyanobacterium stanieri]MBE9223050.1 gamma-glutamylcyclotransferase [Cyanobacterium stanieri LEGE 03274]
MKIFVYGTLKPQEVNYYLYCAQKTIYEQKCWTYGDIYSLSLGYPAMLKSQNKVQGYLLTFPDSSALEKIDQLEGYQENREPHLNDYQREKVMVYDYDNRAIDEAWTYFMTQEKINFYQGILISSGEWKSH